MIYIGSDHAGFELKEEIADALEAADLEFTDLGPEALVQDDDYPDYAFAVGEAVAEDPEAMGILVCGSAQGVCIAANKVNGVRAVAVSNPQDAERAREHNDANILCLSGWNLKLDDVAPIIDTFISTEFSGEERHIRRISKILTYEEERPKLQ